MGNERERVKKGYLLCSYLSGIVARSCYNVHEMDGLGKGAIIWMGWRDGCVDGGGRVGMGVGGWNEGRWM